MIMKLNELDHVPARVRWINLNGELKCVSEKLTPEQLIKPHPMFPIERPDHE